MQNVIYQIAYPNPGIYVEVYQPDGWRDEEEEISFENLSPESVFNATKLVWRGQNASNLYTYLQGGITGASNGVFEGVGLRILADTDVVFDGIIDLTDPETKFACDVVSAKIRDKRMDMVSQNFDSVTYSFFATDFASGGVGVGNPGYITPREISAGGDYVVLPYQRNDIPDGIEFVTTGIAIYQIFTLLENAINTLSADIAGLADVLSDVWGALAIAAEVVWIVFLLIAIVDLLKAMFNYLISPVLTKFGMFARTLIQKACDYFQIGFSSTILNDPSSPYYNLVVMPEKSAWITNQSFTRTLMNATLGGSTVSNRMEYDDLYNLHHNSSSATGLAAYGYYNGSPAQLLKSLGEVFNAQAKIILNSSGNPVLYFERYDYQYNIATYTAPNMSDQTPFNSVQGIFNPAGGSKSAFGTNASELASSYFLKYATDDSDMNTYNYYEGTSCMATTSPINYPSNPQHLLLKNIEEKNFEFAQAFRKDRLSAVEEAFLPMYSACSIIIGILVSIPNAAISTINSLLPSSSQINTLSNPLPTNPPFAQIGQMLLTHNTTSVPKLLIVNSAPITYTYPGISDWSGRTFQGYQISLFNKGLLGARYLMRNFHWSKLPISKVPTQIYNYTTANAGIFITFPIVWTGNITNSIGVPYAPGSTYFNQWLKYQDQELSLCASDYLVIKNNNIIKTFDGQFAKVDSLRYNRFKGMAVMDYRINKQYTNNLRINFLVDGMLSLGLGQL